MSKSPPSISVLIGQNIRRYRIAKGLTQEELAGKVGLSRTSVVNLESGKQSILVHKLGEYAEALGVDYVDLMGHPTGPQIEVIVDGNPVNSMLPPEMHKALAEWVRGWPQAAPKDPA